MTRNDIDDLMRDNGIVVVGEAVYALCQLIAAREKEACAALCERFANRMMSAEECADAIRAGSEQ